VSGTRRRALLLGALLPAAWPAARADVRRGRVLSFPPDHGAHLDTRTEWWYATGWIGSEAAPSHGFQVTFFRTATGLAAALDSRFAARQLLFAHVAITDLVAGSHQHAQRILRWDGRSRGGAGYASEEDTDLAVGPWQISRESVGGFSRYRTRFTIGRAKLAVMLDLQASAPPLLQGDAGFSRKGPEERHASHYVTEPQLTARATLLRGGAALLAATGRAWLDHEWSDELLAEGAVGWDWTGINLFDGSALTAFRLRRADGSVLWAGGSWRPPGTGAARSFSPEEVVFTAGRRWRSPQSGASYPVQWQLALPTGRYALRALLDAQELDSRASSGALYWEGLSELLDDRGTRVGLGYLEMTGYAEPIRLG